MLIMQDRAVLSAMLLLGSRAVTSRVVESGAVQAREDLAPQDPALQKDGLYMAPSLSTTFC